MDTSQTVKIQKQTEAEKDTYLVECFHDSGFIEKLIENDYTIVSGRKGSGKTAIARYLEEKPEKYGVDVAHRISVRNISLSVGEVIENRTNSIAFFILIMTIKKLLAEGAFHNNAKKFWQDFLLQNGLQLVMDYETFIEVQKEHKKGFNLGGGLSAILSSLTAKVNEQDSTSLSRVKITNSPNMLMENLKYSISDDLKAIVLVDDTTDYLDSSDRGTAKEEITIIRDLLLKLEGYNSMLVGAGKNLRFVSLIRHDLFDLAEGSNINKLRTNSLELEWDEKSFASLLIKRLPLFQDSLEVSLLQPIKSIRKQFPDEIFSETIEHFETNRYATNFYAYMIAISFNRPRDFLMFCFAMRDRLSTKHPATFENIESAEIEYSDYFRYELRDELFLAGRILGYNFDEENLNSLIDILSKKNGVNSTELKNHLSKYLGEKTSLGKKKIEIFINELWRYGILGFKEDKKDTLIHFKYISSSVPLILEKIKNYIYFLHRGLWWFAEKRRKQNS